MVKTMTNEIWRDLARIVGDAQRRLSEKKTASNGLHSVEAVPLTPEVHGSATPAP